MSNNSCNIPVVNWRQIGNISNANQFNNVFFDYVNANNLSIKNNFLIGNLSVTYNIISRSIDVSNIYVSGNLYSYNNIYCNNDISLNHNLYVGNDIYLNNKLYFGTNLYDTYNNYSFMYGNSIAGKFGMNTQTPLTVFDIYSSDASCILTLRTNANTTRNILSQNSRYNGVSVESDLSSASIFFYNASNIKTNTHSSSDSYIQLITNTDNENIFSIYSASTLSIDSSVNIILDTSGNTYVRTNMEIGKNYPSNRNYLNEAVSIYSNQTFVGSSLNPFQYSVYKNKNYYGGNALSLVSTDQSSNTCFNIVTPSGEHGMYITAGPDISNSAFSMGIIGLKNSYNTFIPTQTIVSGNSIFKYPSTTGFNTFYPKKDNYVVHINGPTTITNGELYTSLDISYGITSFNYSTNTNVGIVVGNTYNSIDASYSKYISTTIDGGKTWNTSNFQSSVFNQNINFNLDSFIYDASISLIFSNNFKYIFQSSDQFKTWKKLVDTNNTTKVFNTAYIFSYGKDVNNHPLVNIVFGGNACYYIATYNSYTNTIYNYDSTYYTINTTIQTFTNTNLNIQNITGNSNIVYFTGISGIEKYDLSVISSGPLNTYYNSKTYNSISLYDLSNVVSVGSNIISYTNNGGVNWYDATVNYSNQYVLNSVYVYDSSNAIAVGNNGLLFYTINNYKTWNQLDNRLLSYCGRASNIIDYNVNLKNIYMDCKNSFFVSAIRTDISYSYIYHGYFPSIFNSNNNKLLDICGNMEITGNILIDGSGAISSTNNTFYLLNENVGNIYLGSSITTNILQGTLNLAGDASLNSRLFVRGDASLNSRLFVGGDASLNSRLFVGGDASLNSRLFVSGDASLNSRLFVGGDASLNSRLFVGGDASLNSRLFVGEDVSLNSRVFVGGDVSLNSRVFVGGDASLNRRLFVGGDVSLNSRLFLGGDASFNGNLSLGGNLLLNNFNIFSNNSNVYSSLSISGDLSLNRRLFVGGDASLNSRLFVIGDASLNGNLYVNNNSIINRRLIVIGDTSFNSRLFVGADVSLNGRLFVVSDVSINGNISSNNSNFYNSVINNVSSSLPSYTNYALSLQHSNTGGYSTIVFNNNSVSNKYSFISFFDNVYLSSARIPDSYSYPYNDPINNKNNFGFYNYFDKLSSSTSIGIVIGTRDPAGYYNSTSSAQAGTLANDDYVIIQPDGAIILDAAYYSQSTPKFGATIIQPRGGYVGIGVNGTSLNSGLYALDISGNLNLSSNFYIKGDISMNGHINIVGDLSINNSRLFVGGDAFLASRLFVGGDASLNRRLLVIGDAFLASRLFVGGDASLNNRLFVGGDASLNNRLFVGGDASLNNRLIVGGDASLNNRLFVGGDVSLNGGLYVNNDTTLNKRLIINGDVSLNSRIFLTGDLSLNNRLIVAGDSSLNNRLFVTGGVSFNNNLFVVGDVSLNNRLYVGSDVSLNGRLIVGKDVSFNANTFINTCTINGKTSFIGDISVNSNIVGNTNSYCFIKNFESIDYIGPSSTGTSTLNIACITQTAGNKVINIGNNSSSTARTVVNIGNIGDRTFIAGNLQVGNISVTGSISYSSTSYSSYTTQYYTYSTYGSNGSIYVNDNTGITSTVGRTTSDIYSSGKGVIIYDSSNTKVGGIVVSTDCCGYIFSTPISSNKIRLEIDNLNLNTSNYSNGLLILKKPTSSVDSSYNINVNPSVYFDSLNNLCILNGTNIVGNIKLGNISTSSYPTTLNANISNVSSANTSFEASGNSLFYGNAFIINNPVITDSGSLTGTFGPYLNIGSTKSTKKTGINLVSNSYTLLSPYNFQMYAYSDNNGYTTFEVSNNEVLRFTYDKNIIINNYPLYFSQNKNSYISYATNNVSTVNTTLYSDIGYLSTYTGASNQLGWNSNGVTINNNITTPILNISVPSTSTNDINSSNSSLISGNNSIKIVNNNNSISTGIQFNSAATTYGYLSFQSSVLTTYAGTLISSYYDGNNLEVLSFYTSSTLNRLLYRERLRITNIVQVFFDASFGSRLFVANDVSFSSRLFVAGDSSFNGNLSVNGNISNNGSNSSFAYLSINDTKTYSSTSAISNTNSSFSLYNTNSPTITFNNTSIDTNGYAFISFYGNVSNLVVPNSYLNNRLYNYFDTTSTTNYSGLVIGTRTNSYLILQPSSSIVLDSANYSNLIPSYGSTIIQPRGGNVAIGKTVPLFQLDISGSMYVSNNVYIMNNIIIAGDTSLNSRLLLGGDASLNKGLFLGGDASLNNRLFVGKDASFNSRLFVGGDAFLYRRLIITSDTSLNSCLCVGGDASLNSRVFVGGDVSLNSCVFVGGDVSLNNRVFVGGDVSLNNRVFVGGDVSLNSRVFVGGDVSLNSRVFVGGDASLNSRVFVGGDASLNSRVFVGGDVSLNRNLFVSGNSTIGSSVIVNGDVSLNGLLKINYPDNSIPSSAINGIINTTNQSFAGDKTFTGMLNSNNISFSDNSILSTNDYNYDETQFATSWNALNNFVPTNILSNSISENGKYILIGTSNYIYLSNNYGVSGSWQNVLNQSNYWYSTSISSNGKYQTALGSGSAITPNTIQTASVNLYVSSSYGVSGSWNQISTFSSSFTSTSIYTGVCNLSVSSTGMYQTASVNTKLYISSSYGLNGTWYSPTIGNGTNVITSNKLSNNASYFVISSYNGSNGSIYISSNYGSNWYNLITTYSFNTISSIAISNDGKYQSIGSSSGYIYTNSNYGESSYWIQSNVTKNYKAISMSSTGKFQIASTVDNIIYTNTNYGVGTWTQNNNFLNTSTSNSCLSISANGRFVLFTPSYSTDSSNIYQSVLPYQSIHIGSGGISSTGNMTVNGNVKVSGISTLAYTVMNGDLYFNTGNIYLNNGNVTTNVITATKFVYSSDHRIKKEVLKLDGVYALDILRKIEPKTFRYIDNDTDNDIDTIHPERSLDVSKNSTLNFGFIAQELKDVFEHSVSLRKDFIPNIYSEVLVIEGTYVKINAGNSNTDTISFNKNQPTKILFYDNQKNRIIRYLHKIIDNKSFTITEPIHFSTNTVGKIFAYGQEIDDFHSIDPNIIFTMTTAAVKVIDNDLQQLIMVCREQEEEIQNQKEEIRILKEQVSSILGMM